VGGHREPQTPVAEIEQHLPRDRLAAVRARALVERFSANLPAQVIFDGRLVVSELVANCVQHGGASDRVTVHVSRTDGHLPVWVACAKGLTRPHVRRSRYLAGEGGLGLRIVERLATEWGVEDHGLDTVVWAKLPIPTPSGKADRVWSG
jgi:anti-sigma regulatory factor (Ser/Thr protein kinase)